MVTEPSVDPLSATTTSPWMPTSCSAAKALSMQSAIDCASLRQGITTDTSGPLTCAGPSAASPFVSGSSFPQTFLSERMMCLFSVADVCIPVNAQHTQEHRRKQYLDAEEKRERAEEHGPNGLELAEAAVRPLQK